MSDRPFAPRLRLEHLECRTTPTFLGGATVAAGDFDADGIPDLVTGAGPGGGAHARVFSGRTGQELLGLMAYDPGFTGGMTVAAGDVDGDGRAELVTAAGSGGGPHVRVFRSDGSELMGFFAYDPGFGGGVRVAAADVTGDGRADIVTAAGAGGGPHVKVFDGATGTEVRSFYAYDPGFTGGVNVAAADVNGDGVAEVVTGAGAGGGPNVKMFDGLTGAESASFLAYDPGFTGGVSVAVGQMTGLPAGVILTGTGAGTAGLVRAFRSTDAALVREYAPYGPGFLGGVWVAAPDVDGDGWNDVVTGTGPGGGPHVKVTGGSTAAPLTELFAYGQEVVPLAGFGVPAGTAPGPDADFDDLSDRLEAFFGTDPVSDDTDGDLLFDGFEASARGLNPLTADDLRVDWDGDGLTALAEAIYGTRPDRSDTDEDRLTDGFEVTQGSSPTNFRDKTAAAPGDFVELELSVGDHSGSESERYHMVLNDANRGGISNALFARIRHQADRFGVVETAVYKFRRGSKYNISLEHRGTNLETAPDFDYTARIRKLGGSSNNAIIEDPQGIIQVYDGGDPGLPFTASGKQATLQIPKLAPGVYVAARDLAGAAFVGTHQYIILVPENPSAFSASTKLSDGSKVIILGAHNTGRLQVKPFEASDTAATEEYVNPAANVSSFLPDFDTQVDRVLLTGGVDATISRIIAAVNRYVSYEATHPLIYPTGGTFGGSGYNSNSWAQSVIEYTVGRGRVRENFTGLDTLATQRIPKVYFGL